MAQNQAIVIGVNQYEFLQPLQYAQRDAEAMRDFLLNQAHFDRVFFFSDDSPAIGGKSTKPFGANILRVLRQIFAEPFMGDGDNFWFFFSGHGIRHHDRDYLMPVDGDPENIERTGISTHYITERLRRCGADNVVMILDACRNQGRKAGEGIGQPTEAEARQTGVISIFSCSPEQYSYELAALQQGAFTTALLEGLGIRGRCATVERLNQYLEARVPELVAQYVGNARQVPYLIAEPIAKSHLILMPEFASLADIATLKNDAYRAQTRQDWDLAQRLWIRVLAAASGRDMEAVEALQNIALGRSRGNLPPQSPTPAPSPEPNKASQPVSVPLPSEETPSTSSQTTPSHQTTPSQPKNWTINPKVSSASSSTKRISTIAPSWTRQQFIKFVIPAGIGVIGASVLNLLNRERTQLPNAESVEDASGDRSVLGDSDTLPIKVGILHSLSGTMAISETATVEAEELAIQEINAAGGLLGRPIEAIKEDAASDWSTFAEKAKKLINQDRVVAIFGGLTSAARKTLLPIFEDNNHMLWYPANYEGQECSKNIFYTGAVFNQQVEPAVEWLIENKGSTFFLVGSDYVFPRTINTAIKAQLQTLGGETVGEDYLPLGSTEISPIIQKIKAALPNGGVIFNSFNGDTNVAFFRQLQAEGLNPESHPVMSVSFTEEEVRAIGPEYLVGHYAAWNYFQTVDTPENREWVAAFKSEYGQDRLVTDPMEAAYIMVYLWKQAVEKAGTADNLEAVRQAAYGQEFNAPEGKVKMNVNHHLSKPVRIGQVRQDGLFEIVWTSDTAIAPIPWNQFIPDTRGFACDWSDPFRGEKYRTN